MANTSNKLAIIVGGGPAPGINSVIGATTIRAVQGGTEVVGIHNGYKGIMRGDVSGVEPLTIDKVSRIHFRGGSYLGTARDNPTTSDEYLENCVKSLLQLDVDKLVSIGGDDTAHSAMRVAEKAEGRLRVVHVPKTIDNDLDLPHGIPTFGYNTARHLGVKLVENMMVDAKTTGRWYYIVSMGRNAGHLALGMGKAAGATITLIPEEFPGERLDLDHLADILVGAIIKRLSYGRRDGVAILAEGLVERLDPAELADLESVERDAHGHIRLSEISFGDVIKQRVKSRLKELEVDLRIVPTDIGYELRCADPIPFDMEYTRDLGHCAAQYILDGGDKAMVSMQNGHFVPIPFSKLFDPETGRTKVRVVDVTAESYKIARSYMLRLSKADFENPHELNKLASTANLSPQEFKDRFYYLVERDVLYQQAGSPEVRV